MGCLSRNKPLGEERKRIRAYRQRIFKEKRERGVFESTVGKYHKLKKEIGKLWKLRRIEVVPVVI